MVWSKRFEEDKAEAKRKERKGLEATIQSAKKLIAESEKRLSQLGKK